MKLLLTFPYFSHFFSFSFPIFLAYFADFPRFFPFSLAKPNGPPSPRGTVGDLLRLRRRGGGVAPSAEAALGAQVETQLLTEDLQDAFGERMERRGKRGRKRGESERRVSE